MQKSTVDVRMYIAYIILLLSQIEEISESHDGSHFYDELPCNKRKDAHTGENAYQADEDSSVCMYMHKGVVLSLSI